MAVMLFYLRENNLSLTDIGLDFKGISFHAVWIGLASALVWTGLMQLVYIPFIRHFFTVPDYTEYNFMQNHLNTLITTLIAAWIVGGLYEEIIFRGFIRSTLEKYILEKRTHRYSQPIPAVITSLLFGLYHWQQDVFGVISAFMGGFYWTYLLGRYKGNLWYPIFCHAWFDTLALTMIYFDVFGKVHY
ncbi:CPBP family intramembrane metalloprotease [Cytophagaceae bacterium YF14B1]|uniref:CPBP family intramembrane metalloprotease n=1 Tax=Xanthocytophaga flava TaxID=3048013 RepID=A0AAE3UA99_9BACT|nr:CPBP family intramembrane glutamic endopeptidase [Xanthocytophaga flavus]MDJ1485939.1 CPBP family intramembrane metalloprotease [Xanthocytophaga flavus]